MKKNHIIAQSDPNMRVGQCAVIVNGREVYAGRLGTPVMPFLKEGVTLVLHPTDFADGEWFRKNVWEKLN